MRAWKDDKNDRLLQPKQLASGKLTWQWKMALLKMYSLFENGFHCHVSIQGGSNAPKKRNVLKFDPQI